MGAQRWAPIFRNKNPVPSARPASFRAKNRALCRNPNFLKQNAADLAAAVPFSKQKSRPTATGANGKRQKTGKRASGAEGLLPPAQNGCARLINPQLQLWDFRGRMESEPFQRFQETARETVETVPRGVRGPDPPTEVGGK